jgi:hypothetical protein
MEWTTLLSATVVAAVVSGIVSFIISERNIKIKNVTQERAKWRDKIRELCIEVFDACRLHDVTCSITRLEALHAEFQVRLNPLDKNDIEILESIENLKDKTKIDENLKKFSACVALLLKHDWERAKCEATMWPFRWLYLPYVKMCGRISYNKYQKKREIKDRALLGKLKK